MLKGAKLAAEIAPAKSLVSTREYLLKEMQ